MKVEIKDLTVTIKEYPREIILTFDDEYDMQHFLLNLVGLELGKGL